MDKKHNDEYNPADQAEFMFRAGRSMKKLSLREGAEEADLNAKKQSRKPERGEVFRPNGPERDRKKGGKDLKSREGPAAVIGKSITEQDAKTDSFQPYASSKAAGSAAKTSANAAGKAGAKASKEIAGAAGKSNAITAAAQAAAKGFKQIAESARSSSESGGKKGNGILYLIGVIGALVILGSLPFLVLAESLGLSGGPPDDAVTGDYVQSDGIFLWPLPEPYGPECISSGYGYRSDPFSGYASFHNGIDIAAPLNTEIYAVLGGTVVISADGWNGGCGNYTVIHHSGNLYTEYMHQNARAVRVGDRVRKGDVIGYVGTTGSSTGYHLHLGVVVSDHGFDYTRRVDPSTYLGLRTGNRRGQS